jgi:hypothetical protein
VQHSKVIFLATLWNSNLRVVPAAVIKQPFTLRASAMASPCSEVGVRQDFEELIPLDPASFSEAPEVLAAEVRKARLEPSGLLGKGGTGRVRI